jgi:hypothetical protein
MPGSRAAAPALCALLAACGPGGPPEMARPQRMVDPPAIPVIASSGWTFDVAAGPACAELLVSATFPPGVGGELSVNDTAEPFVRDVEIASPGGGGWRAAEPAGTSWLAPACAARGCQVRWRFLLAEAARELDDLDVAKEHGGALLAPPSTWLLRPLEQGEGTPYRLRVATAPGTSFVTGVFPAAASPGVYQADAADLSAAPFAAFGDLRTSRLDDRGFPIDLAILPGALGLPDEAYADWVVTAARAVTDHYGRFPLRRALVMILPTVGGWIGPAHTLGNGGAAVVAKVGHLVTRAELERDWVMTHEMIHLAFPGLGPEHAWLEEGLPTYLEPFLRSRRGTITPEEAWRGLVRGLPQGLPGPGDRGLDRTPTWGRTYWGGALFYLLADLEIRERTGDRRSLDDALRGVLAAGGDISCRWELGRLLDAADGATGLTVLRDLHARMGAAPLAVDLAALWDRLGIERRGSEVVLNETAPLAAIRRSMTARHVQKVLGYSTATPGR